MLWKNHNIRKTIRSLNVVIKSEVKENACE